MLLKISKEEIQTLQMHLLPVMRDLELRVHSNEPKSKRALFAEDRKVLGGIYNRLTMLKLKANTD